MIRYQFRPSLVDHGQLFILVRPFYSATDADLTAVNSKLSKFQCAQIHNDNKILRFKFHKGFAREHYDWGKLQTHRKPVGLIGKNLEYTQIFVQVPIPANTTKVLCISG